MGKEQRNEGIRRKGKDVAKRKATQKAEGNFDLGNY